MNYPTKYSVACFYLLRPLNAGKQCSVETLKAAIYDRDLLSLFADQEVYVEPSSYTDELYDQLADLVDTHIDHKLLANAENGYALLIAYLLELIQRHAPNR